MKDYRLLSQNLIEELKNNSVIEIIESSLGNTLTEKDIELIESSFDVTIPGLLREFYMNLNGLYFKWILKDNNSDFSFLNSDETGHVYGECNILDLETVLFGIGKNGWKDYIWFDNMPVAKQEELKSLRPFDFFDNHDSACVCCKIKNNILDGLNLDYYSVHDGMTTFGEDIFSYFGLLVKSKGFVNWQLAYMFKKSGENKKLNFYLPQIFPDIDLSLFK